MPLSGVEFKGSNSEQSKGDGASVHFDLPTTEWIIVKRPDLVEPDIELDPIGGCSSLTILVGGLQNPLTEMSMSVANCVEQVVSPVQFDERRQ